MVQLFKQTNLIVKKRIRNNSLFLFKIKMKTILILDDFESSAWITTQTLKQLNAKFITCTDSIVALNHFLNNEDIDLLITDLNMPKMNGIELIQKIKYIEKYFTLPVIILTTEIKEEMKLKANEVGVTKWIQKPFKVNEL